MLSKIKLNSQWGILSGIILLAVFFRFKLNFATPLLPGVNGGYYPLMIREFMQTGKLAFQDLPLVFFIETLLSYLIQLFGFSDEWSIIQASKLIDSLLPPIMAIPVFLIAQQLTKKLWPSSLLAGFIVLYYPVSYLLIGEAHKNAIALIWMCWGFWAGLEYQTKQKRKYLIWLISAILLLCLTHFGTLLVTLFALALLTLKGVKKPKALYTTTAVFFLAAVFTALILVALVPVRGHNLLVLIGHPLQFFAQPTGLLLLDGQSIFHPITLVFATATHLMSIGLLILSIRHKKAQIWAAMGFVLSTPFIGIDWYLRLLMMAHIPMAFGIILLWPKLNKLFKKGIMGLLSLLIAGSVLLLLIDNKPQSLSSEEYTDLKSLAETDSIKPDQLIIAEHGLEWWTAWFLNTHIAQEQAITPSDFINHQIFILSRSNKSASQTIKGQTNFTPPHLPHQAQLKWKGSGLALHQIQQKNFIFHLPDKNLLGSGLILKSPTGQWQLITQLYQYKLKLTEAQAATIRQENPTQPYRVYGQKVPFSLRIEVAEIQAL